MAIRILVIEPEELVRQSLTALLNSHRKLQVVAESADGTDALQLADRYAPDVILLEIALPSLRGIPLLRKLAAEVSSAKVLVLTAADAPFNVHLAIEAGAVGYLFKTARARDLFEAVARVHTGSCAFSPAIPALLKKLFAFPARRRGAPSIPGNNLSRREVNVLCMIANSYDNDQIAEDMAISVKTVQKHRQRTMDKLNLHNVQALTRFAISAGWLDPTCAGRTVCAAA